MGEKETYFHRHTFAVVWLLRSKEKRETERPHVEAKRPTARGKRDLQYEAKETYSMRQMRPTLRQQQPNIGTKDTR